MRQRNSSHRGAQQTCWRALHLIDVENLLGGPNFDRRQAAWGRAAYLATAPDAIVNQLVISSSHRAAPAAWFAWPYSTRRLVRSGPDGADLALLDLLSVEQVHTRYDRVVIGSGDGIFALPAAKLQAAGCAVTVVTRGESLARELRLAVRDIRFLGSPPRVAQARAAA
jgi:NYN domain